MGKRIFWTIIGFVFLSAEVRAQYCIPTYSNSCSGTGSYINKFSFHTLNNNNSGCNGNPQNYILYPASGNTTTTVIQGSVVSFTVKPGSGSGNDQGIGIWVDWNNDADFSDADELIYCSPAVSDDQISGTIPIPFHDSYVGQRRLRVRSARDAIIYPSDACTPYLNGETEDYVITVLSPAPCSGVPQAGVLRAFPSSLCSPGQDVALVLAGHTLAAQLLFEWEYSTDGSTWMSLNGPNAAQHILTAVQASAYYRAGITCLNSGGKQYSNSVFVAVGPVTLDAVSGDTICGADSARLVAAGSAQQILWYRDTLEPLPLATSLPGDTFKYLTATSTQLYAAGTSGPGYIDAVGLPDPLAYTGSDGYKNGFMVFDVFRSCTLAGVHVYPSSKGSLFISLRDSSFNTVEQTVFVVPEDAEGKRIFVPLNFALSPGNGYQLFLDDESEKLWSSQGAINYPHRLPGVMQIRTSNLGPGYYHYFYDWIIVSGQGCTTNRIAAAVTVLEAPPLEVTSSSGTFGLCAGSADTLTLSATAGFNHYQWQPTTGLSDATQAVVQAFPSVTTQYSLTASLYGCISQTQVTVQVHAPVSIQVSPVSDTLCSGNSVQLNAMAAPVLNYEIEVVPFVADSFIGQQLYLDDDEVTSALPIGFPFLFYGKHYEHFYLSSNGFITFEAGGGDGCCTGQLMPNPFPPNNLIALAWEDLAPNLGGSISYYTDGTAPNRRLVVRFDSVPHFSFNGAVDPVTVRVELYEQNNQIEIHTFSMPGNPNGNWFGHTQGIESEGGLNAVPVPGRNASIWTAQQSAYRFKPKYYVYSWTPAEGLSDAGSDGPVATPQQSTTYTVTATDLATGCSASASVSLTVLEEPKAGITTPGWVFVCDTAWVELQVSGYTPGASLQWQQWNAATGIFDDVPGATAHTINVMASGSSAYRVKASCSTSAYSDTASISFLNTPLPPAASAAARCGPGKLILSAAGQSDLLCWYNQPAGGDFLGLGSSLVLTNLAATDTFWVEEGAPPQQFLSTSLNGGAQEHGIAFNVYAHENLMITGLDLHLALSAGVTVQVYYRKGPYQGYLQDADRWVHAGTATLDGQGFGVFTPLTLPLSIVVPQGQYVGIYVTATQPLLFSTPASSGTVFISDSLLSLTEGTGVTYPFGSETGMRRWNGRMYYTVLACNSGRTPVVATVYYPNIIATTANPVVCALDTILLQAVNLGMGSFNYQWYPLLQGTNPPNGAAAQITTVPVQSTLFTLIATEVNNQCDTIVQLFVEAHPLPEVSLGGLPDTTHTMAPPTPLTGIPAGGVFSGAGIVNGNFFDPALAGEGTHQITYTYTDANGCTASAVDQVVVLLFSGQSPGIAGVQLYPNPAYDWIMVVCDFCDPQAVFAVYDLTGRLMTTWQPASQYQRLNVSGWPRGMYWLQIRDAGLRFALPLVLSGQ